MALDPSLSLPAHLFCYFSATRRQCRTLPCFAWQRLHNSEQMGGKAPFATFPASRGPTRSLLTNRGPLSLASKELRKPQDLERQRTTRIPTGTAFSPGHSGRAWTANPLSSGARRRAMLSGPAVSALGTKAQVLLQAASLSVQVKMTAENAERGSREDVDMLSARESFALGCRLGKQALVG